MCDLRKALWTLRQSDNLTVLQASVLFDVHHFGRVTILDLAASLEREQPSISAMVRKLRDIGLAQVNHRVVRLTERGQRVCDQTIAAAAAGETP